MQVGYSICGHSGGYVLSNILYIKSNFNQNVCFAPATPPSRAGQTAIQI